MAATYTITCNGPWMRNKFGDITTTDYSKACGYSKRGCEFSEINKPCPKCGGVVSGRHVNRPTL